MAKHPVGRRKLGCATARLQEAADLSEACSGYIALVSQLPALTWRWLSRVPHLKIFHPSDSASHPPVPVEEKISAPACSGLGGAAKSGLPQSAGDHAMGLSPAE